MLKHPACSILPSVYELLRGIQRRAQSNFLQNLRLRGYEILCGELRDSTSRRRPDISSHHVAVLEYEDLYTTHGQAVEQDVFGEPIS